MEWGSGLGLWLRFGSVTAFCFILKLLMVLELGGSWEVEECREIWMHGSWPRAADWGQSALRLRFENAWWFLPYGLTIGILKLAGETPAPLRVRRKVNSNLAERRPRIRRNFALSPSFET
jgi:hypothetical protein